MIDKNINHCYYIKYNDVHKVTNVKCKKNEICFDEEEDIILPVPKFSYKTPIIQKLHQ